MSGDVMQESQIEIKQSILKEHCFTFKNTSIALIEIPLYQDVKNGGKRGRRFSLIVRAVKEPIQK
jgi:hypothetical protein